MKIEILKLLGLEDKERNKTLHIFALYDDPLYTHITLWCELLLYM